MFVAFKKALDLLLSGDKILIDIIFVTLKMSIASSIIALILGVILGVIYATNEFKGKKILIILNRTLMGLPPVVCGLICFILFCGVGPLRHLKLLYTVTGMVIAQIILITPIVIGMIEPFIKKIYPDIKETSIGINVRGIKLFGLIIIESKYQILTTYLLGFSRAIAEVGAVSMVGGAIMFKTNVMTTAIMNYTNMGNFEMALALGIILFILSFFINLICSVLIKD